MKFNIQRTGWMALACVLSGTALAQQAPSASVSYSTVALAPVPAIGSIAAVLMGLALLLLGARGMRRNPGRLNSAIVAVGLFSSVAGGGWLVGNAQALGVMQYLLSEHPTPVAVTVLPAELTNDLMTDAVIESIDVTGCPGDTEISGTCEVDLLLTANGGSCSLDSICAPTLEGCGNNVVDNGEEYDPPPGPFSSAPVSSQSCRYDFSQVNQFYCNGTCSISGSDGCDQTEADRFCKIKLDDPSAVATGFSTTTALAEPGFSCANENLGTPLDMTSRGVTEPIAYQDSSILANHGSGQVIVNVVCALP